jgi:RNA polymerase sigma-70 factor, ECF subfamily
MRPSQHGVTAVVPDPHSRGSESAGRLDPHAALVAAMAEHDERLRALAFHLLGSRDAMDDVLQEVYLKAHRRLTGFRGDSSLSTWLYRITYTTCVDKLRRGRWTRPAPVEEIEGSLPRVDAEDDAVVRRDELRRALAVLSPERCAAVLLVLRDGHTYAEAAEILGVPQGTVASRVAHGRRQLMRVLSLDDLGGDRR